VENENSEFEPAMESFTDIFSQEEACVLVDLLKLGVANRAGPKAKEAIASMLSGLLMSTARKSFYLNHALIVTSITEMAQSQQSVAEMLLELCVTELEDVAADLESVRSLPVPVVQESSHPYSDNSFLFGRVKIPGTV
jgi:E3 ubiquitin-protein ligase HERC2